MSTRQIPTGSGAVRALTAFGNGTVGPSSRPSTPVPVNPPVSGSLIGGGDGNNAHGLLSHKISKIMADRQTITQQKSFVNVDEDGRISEMDTNQNGKNDSWQEDQEVLYFLYFSLYEYCVSTKDYKRICTTLYCAGFRNCKLSSCWKVRKFKIY